MNPKLRILCLVFADLVVFASCQKESELSSISENMFSEKAETDFVTTEGQTVLGDVIDIPYSIENLLKAYDNLPAQTKSQIDLEDIQPTHLIVKESWAEFAEYILTSLEYASLGINPNNIVDTRQDWTRYAFPVEYSPFFIDCYDSFNQNTSGYSYLYDDITGFSSNQINQVVILSFSLSDAKEYLKMMKPAYISDNQIDSYYNNYVGL